MAGFNTQGMIIAGLFVGLFISILTGSIYLLDTTYDTSGYNETTINKYNNLTGLASDLQKVENSTNLFTPKADAFDFFSDLWSKVIGPFKFIYGSYRVTNSLAQNSVKDFNLMPVFGAFFTSLIIVLVIVGIVLIKMYLGRSKKE